MTWEQTEADTRAELIDPQLATAGWVTGGEVRVLRERPVTDGQIRSGKQRGPVTKPDYILSYKGCFLAVIEAKKSSKNVSDGVAQAKVDSQKIRAGTAFATNGHKIYQICHITGTEGEIDRFPTPEELWNRTYGEANEWAKKFASVPFSDSSRQPRFYQRQAVNRALEAVAGGKKRILLTLATGTGKTFIASQVAWKLFKARWNQQQDGTRSPRILFLADRNVLANQAFLDFTAFNDDALVRIDPKTIKQHGGVPQNASVFFTIFQTFMSGDTPNFEGYSPDFFDFIIIDECHRGGANDEGNWRNILNYFQSATQLGLTATPRREDNADTYDYFGQPVFVYSLKEGIADGFLTPFRVKRITSNIDEYQWEISDDIEGDIDTQKVYKEKEINKLIVIEERERHRVRQMVASIDHDEKTLVFCANQEHAALVRDIVNQEAAGRPADYCVRVTADDGSIGDMHLGQFKDNEKKLPTILTTSQKLSTGVDARNVRNIVLMRPAANMIEFKQIIGRGTRLYDDKSYFTIIDFVRAYELFNDDDWDGPPDEIGDGGDAVNGPYTPIDGVDDPTPEPEPEPGPEGESVKTRVTLSDGRARDLVSVSSTHFFIEGKPEGAKEFMEHLLTKVKLPEILGSEEELRAIWSNPLTRSDLLTKLEKAGCHLDDLKLLQSSLENPNCDLFDVLELVAYAKPPVSRSVRAQMAKSKVATLLNQQQREFVDYVLANYVSDGIEELDASRLSRVIEAKYGGVSEARVQLGAVEEIRETFIQMQKFLYEDEAA